MDALLSEPPGKPKNSGVSSPSLGELPDPGIEPGSPALQADSLPAELPGKPTERIGAGYFNWSDCKKDGDHLVLF